LIRHTRGAEATAALRGIGKWLHPLTFAVLIVTAASAEPFSQLVFFGDSLSDVGNLQDAVSIYPGPYYYDGRFSNGPVFPEALSAGLGWGALVHSTAEGNHFA